LNKFIKKILSKFFFFEKYTLIAKLSPQEVCNRMADNIESYDWSRFFFYYNHTGGSYQGKIFEDRFRIRKIGKFRTSCLPIITGFISAPSTQTEIKIKIRLPIFVFSFHLFPLAVFLFVLIRLVGMAYYSSDHISAFGFLCLFTSFILAYLNISLIKKESEEVKRFLLSLSEADERS
jgi:hypothetical protein